jgi:hypothetical protein
MTKVPVGAAHRAVGLGGSNLSVVATGNGGLCCNSEVRRGVGGPSL